MSINMEGPSEGLSEDTLTAEQLAERQRKTMAEAERIIREENERKAREAAAAVAAAQLRRQKEMVRSAAVGRRAHVSILMSEGAHPDFLFQVGRRAAPCGTVALLHCIEPLQGRTALSVAAEAGHLTTVLALLKAGANFTIENQACVGGPGLEGGRMGVTPCPRGHRRTTACHPSCPLHLRVTRLWCKPFWTSGTTPIEPPQCVWWPVLCASSTNLPCCPQAGGMSPLIFAAMRGYTKTMQLLLDRGANPDQRDDVRRLRTPLPEQPLSAVVYVCAGVLHSVDEGCCGREA